MFQDGSYDTVSPARTPNYTPSGQQSGPPAARADRKTPRRPVKAQSSTPRRPRPVLPNPGNPGKGTCKSPESEPPEAPCSLPREPPKLDADTPSQGVNRLGRSDAPNTTFYGPWERHIASSTAAPYEDNQWWHTLSLQQFQALLTPFSGSFSPFLHSTFSLSVSLPYLALDGINHPVRAAISNNPTHGEGIESIQL